MGAGQNCNDCRSLAEEIYYNRFQCQQFVQFLRPGYDQSLAIPKTFSDNLKKKLPEDVTLKGPGGVVWNIGVTTRDDASYFMNGWEQFVKDHTLKENDLLVFKYNGESLIEVQIFDGVSLCENAASYFVRKCGHSENAGGSSSKMKDTDNSLEEGNNTPSNAGVDCASPEKTPTENVNNVSVPVFVTEETPTEKTLNAGVESADPEQVTADEVTVTVPATAVPFQPISNRIRKSVSVKHVQTKRRGRGRPPKPSYSPESELYWVTETESEPASVGKSISPEYKSNRRGVTKNEIDKALLLAKAVCTDDSFLVVMKPTHVYKRFFLSIPNKWLSDQTSLKSQDMLLRLSGIPNGWKVRYTFDRKRRNGGLTGGWKHFALENNLEEHDVCVFKPAGLINGLLVANVFVFRVVEEIVPLTAPPTPVSSQKRKRGTIQEIKPINME